jgi:hypothetical protein
VITLDTGVKLRKFFDSGEKVKHRGKPGGVFEDKTVIDLLNELGLDSAQHDTAIRKIIGGMDPEAPETMEKLMGRLSAKLDERDAKEEGK